MAHSRKGNCEIVDGEFDAVGEGFLGGGVEMEGGGERGGERNVM